MFFLYIFFLFLWYTLAPCYCQRRIVNGTASVGTPRYLAYFVKTDQSNVEYTGWLCGGCIVHPIYILTSAACLKDVHHIYAIVGYKKYISSEHIDSDPCTSRIKKRVVARLYQKEYNQKIPKPKSWNSRDISLAKLESPFDFRDPVYLLHCSYLPSMIKVNYIKHFEEPGSQAVVFGWGHKKYFRTVNDETDYNEKVVHYASTAVIDKEICKNKLIGHKDIQEQVDAYLICTLGPGSLDELGKMTQFKNFFNNTDCENYNSSDDGNGNYRRDNTNKSHDFYTYSFHGNFRRNGPCQNDHGGPLVSWIGGREYVIGVACGFQVNKNMECVGPFLYTSTYSNAEFLYCMLRYTRGLNFCDKTPAERGFYIIEDPVHWNMTLEEDEKNNSDSSGVPNEEDVINDRAENDRENGTFPRMRQFTSKRRVFINMDYEIFNN